MRKSRGHPGPGRGERGGLGDARCPCSCCWQPPVSPPPLSCPGWWQPAREPGGGTQPPPERVAQWGSPVADLERSLSLPACDWTREGGSGRQALVLIQHFLGGHVLAPSAAAASLAGSPLLVCLQRPPPPPVASAPPGRPCPSSPGRPAATAPGSPRPPGWLASLKSTRLTSILAGQGTGTYRDIRVC